jgi:hypothetical protein
MLQSPRTRRRAERVHDEALDAAASHSCTAVRDRHAASAQHGVAEHCPREAAVLAHVRSACRGGGRRGTTGASGERHGSRREHRAPEGFFNTGLQAGGRFAQQDVGRRSRSSAVEAAKRSAHTVQLC